MNNSNSSISGDVYVNRLESKVKQEMATTSNVSNLDIKVHQNPLTETNKYLFKNNVYDLFKVSERFREILLSFLKRGEGVGRGGFNTF